MLVKGFRMSTVYNKDLSNLMFIRTPFSLTRLTGCYEFNINRYNMIVSESHLHQPNSR